MKKAFLLGLFLSIGTTVFAEIVPADEASPSAESAEAKAELDAILAPKKTPSRQLFSFSSEELSATESLDRVSGGRIDSGFASQDKTYQSNSSHSFKGPFSTDYTS